MNSTPYHRRSGFRLLIRSLIFLALLCTWTGAAYADGLLVQADTPAIKVPLADSSLIVIPRVDDPDHRIVATLHIVKTAGGLSGTEVARLKVHIDNPAPDSTVKLMSRKTREAIPLAGNGEDASNAVRRDTLFVLGNKVRSVVLTADTTADDGTPLTTGSVTLRVLTVPTRVDVADQDNRKLTAEGVPAPLLLTQGAQGKKLTATTDTPDGLIKWSCDDSANVDFSTDNLHFMSPLYVPTNTAVYVRGNAVISTPAHIVAASVIPADAAPSVTFAATAQKPVTDFTIEPAEMAKRSVTEGSALTLTAKNDGQPLSVTWEIKDDASRQAAAFKDSSNKAVYTVAGSNTVQVQGQSAGKAVITVTYAQEGAPSKSEEVPLEIKPLAATVTFGGGISTLIVGQTSSLQLHFYDKDKHEITDMSGFQFQVSVSDDSVLGFNQPEADKRIITLTGKKAGDADLLVTVTTPNANGGSPSDSNSNTKTVKYPIHVGTVTGFRKVKVSLQPMDESTVKTCFGGRMSAEYYVYQIVITNNLGADTTTRTQPAAAQNDPTKATGPNSIIVFSNSVGVRVHLEKEYNGRSGSRDDTNTTAKRAALPPGLLDTRRGWTPVTGADYHFLYGVQEEDESGPGDSLTDAAGLLPTSAADAGFSIVPGNAAIYAGDSLKLNAVTRGKNLDLLWQSLDPTLASVSRTGVVHAKRPGAAHIAVTDTATGKHLMVSLKIMPDDRPRDFVYRPYSSQLVLDTIDVRNTQVNHTTFFNIAHVLATGTSFFTASNILRGELANSILDKYSNLLLPGLEKLFPSPRDAQRQNLERHLMRPTEEIPFGASIQKVLIFPKRSFSSVLRGYQTRISEVLQSYVEVEVGVIEAKNTESGSPSP